MVMASDWQAYDRQFGPYRLLGGFFLWTGPSDAVPEDIRAICKDVLRHRIGLTYEAQAENISAEDIIDKILNTIKVP